MNSCTILIVILSVASNILASGYSSNPASLTPPYTCTTTICQPGASVGSPPTNESSLKRGRDGKRGPVGIKGEKGDKGDPCQCNVADEEEIAKMRRKMEEMTTENEEMREMFSELKLLAFPPQSCLQLRQEGVNESGIYGIKTQNRSQVFEVFCDMESAGGGWTLVASIHENNIGGKCTLGDMWSSEQKNHTPSGNWVNYNTFGSAGAATSADYKNEAFYNLQASDIMIWHVPNDVEILEASQRATIKYFTDTSFLSNFGENLATLFRDHYPLKNVDTTVSLYGQVHSMIRSLNSTAPRIRNVVPGFFNYAYDGGDLQISDGGNDMYDGGNKLSYQIGNQPATRIRYNINYKNSTPGIDLFTATSYPFNLLMWIGNENKEVSSFSLKAEGDAGADGGGSSNTRSGTVSSGEYTLLYHAFSVYGASDPSICKVFYYIVNTEEWNSEVSSVTRSQWSSGTSTINHGIVLSGHPKSTLVGYTLLSKASAVEVIDSEIQAALTKILETISGIGGLSSCDRINTTLTQPVQYLKGNDRLVLNNVPAALRSTSTPGFIQFRAYDKKGFPYPLCPGVKTKSCNRRSVCLGGGLDTESDSCGDFGDETLARSSILIFTRNSV
ncbi:uncharacterized protein LOC120328249 [Styela clava]